MLFFRKTFYFQTWLLIIISIASCAKGPTEKTGVDLINDKFTIIHGWFKDTATNLYGYRNSQGKIVIQPKYNDAKPFSEGLAAVNLGAKRDFGGMIGGKWGYINQKGKVIIPIQYKYAHPFSHGLAIVTTDLSKSIFINNKGVVKFEFKNNWTAKQFSEKLCPIYFDNETKYIDINGKIQFTVQGYARNFSEGLAVFQSSKNNQLYGFINNKGKIVIQPIYKDAKDFKEGLAPICTVKISFLSKDNRWGFINKKGNLIIASKYNEVSQFKNGLAIVHTGGKVVHRADAPSIWQGGDWFNIDKKGNLIK